MPMTVDLWDSEDNLILANEHSKEQKRKAKVPIELGVNFQKRLEKMAEFKIQLNRKDLAQ